MTRSVLWKIFAAMVLWTACPLLGYGATVTVVEEPYKEPTVVLKGPLIPGDAATTIRALRCPEGAGCLPTLPTLSLDSPGGSYEEGLLIAKFVHENRIPTTISDGAACFSACAIIFMAGLVDEDGDIHLDRRLNIHGHLGFHAPYVPSGAGQLDSATLANAYQAGIVAIGRLLDTTRRSRLRDKNAVFPLPLLAEMLKRGPDESFDVDTVKKALEFGIDLTGIPKQKSLTKEMVCNICNAMHPLYPYHACRNDDYVRINESDGSGTLDTRGYGETTIKCIVQTTGRDADGSLSDIFLYVFKDDNNVYAKGSTRLAASINPALSLKDVDNLSLKPLADQLRYLKPFQERSGYTIPKTGQGTSDYQSHELSEIPWATFSRCELICLTDDQCQSFAYDKSNSNLCRTFDFVANFAPQQGSEVGVR